MSDLLSEIGGGKRIRPRRILLYGVPGIGKSTFGSMAPRPIFVPTEEGINDIECDAFFKHRKPKPICTSFAEFMGCLETLYVKDTPFETVVIDTADWLERLVWEQCCARFGVQSIESVDGGYSRGYTHCLAEWREVLTALDAIRDHRGMHVILLAHAKIEKFENPETESYDRYSPRLNKWASDLVREWCDEVLFANTKTYTSVQDEGFGKKKAKGLGDDERILRTTNRPAHVAKNHLSLPYELPLDWREYAKYMPGSTAA